MPITLDGTTGIVTPKWTVSGNLAIGDGSVASPSLTNIGDSDTGVYFPSANTVAVATGGVKRMLIDSTGNVGIGTSSPSVKLDVNGNVFVRGVGAEGGEIAFFNPDRTTTGMTVDVSSTDNGRIFQTTNNSIMQIGQLVGTGGIITFYTANTERLRIASAGQIGIGGANYGTSGQVLTSGGALAPPSWTTAGPGFASSEVSSKIGSRLTATTYQNTTNGWLLVSVSMSNNGQTFLLGSTNALGITGISMNVAGSNMTYMVPPLWYYRVTGTVISVWTEGQA